MSTPAADPGALARASDISNLIRGICNGTIDPEADYATKMPGFFSEKASPQFDASTESFISQANTGSPGAADCVAPDKADTTLPAAGRAGLGMPAACQQYCEFCKWEYYQSYDLTCQRCSKPTVPAAPRRELLLQVCADKATRIGVIWRRSVQHKRWQALCKAKIAVCLGTVEKGELELPITASFEVWDFWDWELGTSNVLHGFGQIISFLIFHEIFHYAFHRGTINMFVKYGTSHCSCFCFPSCTSLYC